MRAFVSNDFPIDAMPLSAQRIVLPPLRVWLIGLLWLWAGIAAAAGIDPKDLLSPQQAFQSVSYTHLTLPTIYSV